MWGLVQMAKDKLQVCLSFKHTEEEEALYNHIISQSDKSAFLKNLIRNSMNGVQPKVYNEVIVNKSVVEDIHIAEPVEVINHGKKTVSKFLA